MSERLYHLLPEIYRVLDYDKGEPLRALMAVLESEFDHVNEDISNLYRNWFIETCDEWVVPYIADLLGMTGVRGDGNVSLRAYVGDTIAYRRRKGTPQVLEEVARDLLERPTRVQEFLFLLTHTQHLNHLRMNRFGTLNLRDPDVCRLVDTAFDVGMHLPEIGRISPVRGLHNLPNVGVSVFRIQSYEIVRGDAFKVGQGRFTFDPFGRDLPIYNKQRTQLDAFQPTLESDVAQPLPRRPIEEELNGLRAGIPDTDGVYFGTQPVFQIFLNGGATPVDPQNIFIADLSTWRNPANASFVAVDPVLGRISAHKTRVTSLKVTYSYGSPGDVGGGPYHQELSADESEQVTYIVGPGGMVSIDAALSDWNPSTNPRLKIILDTNDTIRQNIVFTGSGTEIVLEAAEGTRPVLIGNISTLASSPPQSIEIGGIWISGQIQTQRSLQKLVLRDVTVLAGANPSLVVAADSENLKLTIERCKLGPCELDPQIIKASLKDSILHHIAGTSIAAPAGASGPPVSIERCTILGEVRCRTLDCSESILIGRAIAERTQSGCVRFSWLPLASHVARRFYCQPNLEVDRLCDLSPSTPTAVLEVLATRATYPRFQSRNPYDAAYAQLGKGCPDQVCQGAENEGEVGAWHSLYEQERIANFGIAQDEYLRFGLEGGLIKRT